MACLAVMAIHSRKNFAKLLGQRIRDLRKKKGISLKHFEAKEGAIDRHSLSDIEQGKKIPNAYTLHRIAAVLDIPLDALVRKLK